MAQNRALQIRADWPPGAASQRVQLDARQDLTGGFLHTTSPPSMRVDITAHCLNALLIMDRAGLLEEFR
ncbi:MAG: hypothetical protein WBN68_20515 [Sedimenticolaceae bacterium]